MILTATDVLELLRKANVLNMSPIIAKHDDGYFINLYYDWYDDYQPHSNTVFVTNDNESTGDKGTYNFETMIDILNTKLEEQEQQQIKAQKRKELIARLTSEEKELLGIK